MGTRSLRSVLHANGIDIMGLGGSQSVRCQPRRLVVAEDAPRRRVDVVELAGAHGPRERGDGAGGDQEGEREDDVERGHGSFRNARERSELASTVAELSGISSAATSGWTSPVAAHKQYQRDNCDAAEFSTGSRIADCIKATGETCTVIELKPNNSNAISKGNTQLRDQLRDLNEAVKNPDSSLIKDLIYKKSDFAKCKRFEGRIDCYTLCPVLGEKGEYREANPDWKKDCS